MDILIKNNVIKQNKIVVDMGEFELKLIDVHYAAKRVEITGAKILNAANMFKDGLPDITEIARRVNENTSGKGRRNMTVILPASVCECKIITIKNKKLSDISKIIAKEYATFGKVSNLTHVIDFAYLGKREEHGDTVHYCMLSAISKSFANELVSEFADYKMKITTIIPVEYAQVCLSELYFDDYEDLNRLFIDFGTKSTRVTAFSDGIPVYTRTLGYGFESYCKRLFDELEANGKPEIRSALEVIGLDETKGGNEHFLYIPKDIYYKTVEDTTKEYINEIRRISDMCSNNDITLTKIYYTGFVIPDFAEFLEISTVIKVENIRFGFSDEKEGKDYLVVADTEHLGAEYTNAIGAAIYPVV